MANRSEMWPDTKFLERSRSRKLSWLAPLILVILSTVVLYRSARSASDLFPTPDAVEYATGAAHFIADGHFRIELEGQRLPSRYPPWFSAVVLGPSYLLLGPDPGNGIFSVTLFAVLGVLIAFRIGLRLGGATGALFAALALLNAPAYREWGRLIMSDVPSAVVILILFSHYLRQDQRTERPPRYFFIAGLWTAAAALLRPVSLGAGLPFILLAMVPGPGAPRSWRSRTTDLAIFAAPIFAAVLASAIYNIVTFSSAARSGYNFWCPIPYDYPSLTFSLSYVKRNFSELRSTPVPWVLAALLAIGVIRMFMRPPSDRARLTRERTGRALIFLVFSMTPLVVFHLLYFFASARFFLPLICLTEVLLAAEVGSFLPPAPVAPILATLLLLTPGWRSRHPDPPPVRRIAADRILRRTPDDAVIIVGTDPVYFEYAAALHSHRRIIPASRNIEYANKLIDAHGVAPLSPRPIGWWDHRWRGLWTVGAREAAPYIAGGHLDDLESDLRVGKRVFLDLSQLSATDPEVTRLRARFHAVPVEGPLSELVLSPNEEP